jgi:hypothetical protein
MQDFTYQGGRMIRNINATLIFIRVADDDWQDPYAVPGKTVPVSLVCDLSCFVHDIVSSAYMDVLGAEYSRPGYQIARGSFGGTYFLSVKTRPDVGLVAGDIASEDLTDAIAAAVGSKALPGPTEDSCYLCVVPNEIRWAQGVTGTMQGGVGYHDRLLIGKDTVVPYAAIGQSAVAQGGSGTAALSHEIAELVTDVDNSGWRDRTAYMSPEIADLSGDSVTFHGYEVAQFWSRSQNKMVAPAEDGLRKACTQLSISPGVAYCDGGNREGSTVKLAVSASLDGHTIPVLHCLWSSNDVQIVGPIDELTVKIKVPSPAQPFTLQAYIYDSNGCQVVGTRTFAAVSAQQSAWFRFYCDHVKHLRLKSLLPVRKLLDPMRDMALQPPTEAETRQVGEYAELLGTLADHLKNWPGPGTAKR